MAVSDGIPPAGATGRFPDGKLLPDDEGELNVHCFTSQGRIVLKFGKSITWVSMRPHEARVVALELIRRANMAEEAECKTAPK